MMSEKQAQKFQKHFISISIYAISQTSFWTSFRWGTSGDVAKYRLFSQATVVLVK